MDFYFQSRVSDLNYVWFLSSLKYTNTYRVSIKNDSGHHSGGFAVKISDAFQCQKREQNDSRTSNMRHHSDREFLKKTKEMQGRLFNPRNERLVSVSVPYSPFWFYSGYLFLWLIPIALSLYMPYIYSYYLIL